MAKNEWKSQVIGNKESDFFTPLISGCAELPRRFKVAATNRVSKFKVSTEHTRVPESIVKTEPIVKKFKSSSSETHTV